MEEVKKPGMNRGLKLFIAAVIMVAAVVIAGFLLGLF